MTVPALAASADTLGGPSGRIAAFMSGFSLEATKLDCADIAALQIAGRHAVYLTCVPGRPVASVDRTGQAPARSGLRAGAASRGAKRRQRRRARRSAVRPGGAGGRAPRSGHRRRPRPAGRTVCQRASTDRKRAAAALRHQRDRHRGLSARAIRGSRRWCSRRRLTAKIEAAEQTGLKVHIVTQFCFDAAAVLAGSCGCAISASKIRCGSGWRARPISRR